jgi:hypothetical protein
VLHGASEPARVCTPASCGAAESKPVRRKAEATAHVAAAALPLQRARQQRPACSARKRRAHVFSSAGVRVHAARRRPRRRAVAAAVLERRSALGVQDGLRAGYASTALRQSLLLRCKIARASIALPPLCARIGARRGRRGALQPKPCAHDAHRPVPATSKHHNSGRQPAHRLARALFGGRHDFRVCVRHVSGIAAVHAQAVRVVLNKKRQVGKAAPGLQ